MINNLNEAFKILNTTRKGIPFDAIKYIRNHPTNDEIINKIVSCLNNAYNPEVYYDKESNYYSSEPLWYAIIAENHIVEEMIDPVINLFIQDEKDWDFLNEQGQYLLGLLTEKFQEIVPEKVLSTIENEVKHKTKHVYLYLFDSLYFIDINKNKERLLNILRNNNLYWLDSYTIYLANLEIKEAIPIIEDKLNEIKNKQKREFDNFLIADLEEALEQLKSGINEFAEDSIPYSKRRGDWEAHYKKREHIFYPEEEINNDYYDNDIDSEIEKRSKIKIGRNDPCPCGSGKKYKKCCLK